MMTAPSTMFIPMHRVVRIYVDESTELTPSYESRFEASCGRSAPEALTSEPRRSDGT
jgi:hypothetical protein